MNREFLTDEVERPRQINPMNELLIGLLLTIVGTLVLCYSISNIITYNKKNEIFIETTSRVVDYNVDSDGLRAIVVEYEVDGQTYRMASKSYSNIPKSIGTEIDVKYNPDAPQDAIWSFDSSNIFLPLFGIVFILVGVMVIVTRFKMIM